MGFQLVIAEGKESGREFVFEQASVLVGRTSDCDVVLYDPGVSRQHARIFNEGDKYFVEDMGSSNGTKVNGAIVKKKQLSDGDAITLGPVVFNFSSMELEADAPAAPGEGSTRIVSASDVKRSRGKGVAMVPENAEPEQLAKIARKSTQTMQAVSRPRVSSPGGPALARRAPAPDPDQQQVERPARARPAPLSAAERARIKRETGGPAAGIAVWWAEASKTQRNLAMAGAAVAVLAIGGGGVAALWPEQPKNLPPPEPKELSATPIEQSFGLGEGVIYETPDQKSFDFRFAAPVDAVVLIHFQAKDLSAKELLVSVNGADVGEAPPDTMAVNDRVNEILVPAQLLKKNETNIIIFDSTKNPPGNDPWRIWNLWVEVALLPPLSSEELIAESERKYKQGLELMERANIGAPNLYNAWKAFRTAWLYMESLPEPRPSRYVTSRDKMKEAQLELDKTCAKVLLEAQTFFNQRRWDDARKTLEHVHEFFPVPDQPCPFRAAALREQFEL